ncbi:uncharacterized protein LOC122069135 [Macadamia integrifolia]|uniref:uncharacterized protein LOC122069135 n=1 Tax=Macadamia integrifolia TaxID=60698 RepID=UPI001C4E9473|nr:uncharacterized protein LOC122069135 [Macadamia integrifolia]
MLVANSFDLWQKDAFFTAAEEVQESTDIMESVYRAWLREGRDGIGPEDSEELRRELQITLGTAKWQGCVSTEKALIESLEEEGKQPLRWVNLDEEERDDFTSFLSRTPGTSQGTKEGNDDLRPTTDNSLKGIDRRRKVADFHIDLACRIDNPDCVTDFKEVAALKQDSNYVVKLEARESPGTKDDLSCEVEKSNGHRTTWSTPNIGSWKIVIADEDEQRKTLVESDESRTKGKGFKNSFRRQKGGDHVQSKGRISSWLDFYQRFGRVRVCGSQRQIQGPQYMQFRSLQRLLLVVLSIFLIGMLMISIA